MTSVDITEYDTLKYVDLYKRNVNPRHTKQYVYYATWFDEETKTIYVQLELISRKTSGRNPITKTKHAIGDNMKCVKQPKKAIDNECVDLHSVTETLRGNTRNQFVG